MESYHPSLKRKIASDSHFDALSTGNHQLNLKSSSVQIAKASLKTLESRNALNLTPAQFYPGTSKGNHLCTTSGFTFVSGFISFHLGKDWGTISLSP